MRTRTRLQAAFALLTALLLSFAIAACGDDSSDDTDSGGDTAASGDAIQENPDNNGVQVTVGSKNFTEQYILGEIYAQALEAAGYDVSTDLNLGSEVVALKALEDGQISGYPEYTSTALTSFFKFAPEDVPNDPVAAVEEARSDFEAKGLVPFDPTQFSSANAVGMLASTAQELGISSISDLEDNQDLTLYGSPECRQRIDCLAGLEEYYGLDGLRENFTPVDIGLRYEVLDKGDADLSILFTTDAQLFTSDDYTLLTDDEEVLPAGNIVFVASQEVVDEAGPDFQETIEKVQGNLTLEVMQELNARVDIDKEKPEEAAAQYLEEFGYVE
jgi:glycine betaine/choline ABC-type transport system substrate-binding protein